MTCHCPSGHISETASLLPKDGCGVFWEGLAMGLGRWILDPRHSPALFAWPETTRSSLADASLEHQVDMSGWTCWGPRAQHASFLIESLGAGLSSGLDAGPGSGIHAGWVLGYVQGPGF